MAEQPESPKQELPPDAAQLTGRTVGAYRILRPLGRGGMGEVFLAYDERLERSVAIKRVRLERSGSAQERRRFRREARLAARISHPSVVHIHDILQVDGDDYLVMEYARGQCLARQLEQGPLPPERSLGLAIQIAEGLHEAHRRGLVHRDLKAENIIVSEDGQAKILDFGLAKPLSGDDLDHDLTRAGAVVGTSRAMSPEQARGEPVDHRSDLFSLGVLIYEMITGRTPFKAASIQATLANVLTLEPEPVSRLSAQSTPQLDGLVADLLMKDPQERPQSAAETVARLKRLAGDSDRIPAPGSEGGPNLSRASTGSFGPAALGSPGARIGSRSWRLAAGRRVKAAASLLLVVLVAAAAVSIYRWLSSPAEILRVAVLEPRILPEEDEREEIKLVARSAFLAVQRTLISLDGISTLAPSDRAGFPDSPQRAGLALAADESLALRVEAHDERCRVSMERINADSAVLWSDFIWTPCEPNEFLSMLEAVRARIRQAYPDRRLRAGFPDLHVEREDLAAFLRLIEEVNQGPKSLEPLLERTERIVRSSPRFIDAYLLAAELSRSLHSSSGDRKRLEDGLRFAQEAARLSPQDPRPAFRRLLLLLQDGMTESVRLGLEEIEGLIDPAQAFLLRSQIASREGDGPQAIEWMEKAAGVFPSWQNLYRLGSLQLQGGHIQAARQSFESLLARDPDNRWGRGRLAQLEISYGDLERAEQEYSRLSKSYSRPHHFNNLGLARYLQGRYREAIEAYQGALSLSPEDHSARLNLADAYLALGDTSQAEALYRGLIKRLDSQSPSAELDVKALLIKGQCLARVNRSDEAVEAALLAQRKRPDDPEVLYESSLIYALSGDRNSALVLARKALEKGFLARWFEIPAFESLRAELPLEPTRR